MDTFVTIATFQFPAEAHLARGLLESEGIEARILDEHVVSINWLYSNAIGGVKLQVREADAQRAIALLPSREASHEVVLLPCPKCHSQTVSLEVRRWYQLLRWRRRWKCSLCGHTEVR